jgi:hypothetical protein
MTITNSGSPFIETSLVGTNHELEQEIVKIFFRRNPLPTRVEIINNDKEHGVQIPVRGYSVPANENGVPANENPAPSTAQGITIPATTAAIPPTEPPPQNNSSPN